MDENEARELFNHDPEIKARIAATHAMVEHLLPISIEAARLVDAAGNDEIASLPMQDIMQAHFATLSEAELRDMVQALMSMLGSVIYGFKTGLLS
jgi:hypothetical protein